MRIRRLASTALLAALALSQPALAQDDAERLRQLYQDGQVAFDAGEFQTAHDLWNQAYELSGRALLLVKMADAMEGAENFPEAVLLLDEYRQYAEHSELDALEQRIQSLYDRQAEAEANQAELKAAQRRAEERERWLQDSTDAPAAVESTEDTVAVAPAEKKGGSVGLEVALVGLTVAGLGTGVTLGVLSSGAGASAEASCVDVSGTLVCDQAGTDYASQQQGLALGADIGWGVAALAGTAAIVNGIMLFTDSRGPRIGGMVGPGGGVVTFGGKF